MTVGTALPRLKPVIAVLAVALVGTVLLSFMIGQYPISPYVSAAVFLSHIFPISPFWPPQIDAIVMQIRLPRIAAALAVGAALSASGAAYQGVFRNPMVSPEILGVSAGASFGAALAILLKLGAAATQGFAFASGLLAVAIAYFIGSWGGRYGGVLTMVLAGFIVGMVFTAFVSLVKYVADPYNILPAITFWLMGSVASVSAADLAVAAVPMCAGLAVVMLLRWRLNVLTFGDEEARALGIDVRRMRLAIIVGATLMAASAVAISGVIGLVGLVVPHLARMLVGPDYRILLPACTLLGAIFLLIVDDVARVLASGEVPVGILSSLIGAPVFFYLLTTAKKGWV